MSGTQIFELVTGMLSGLALFMFGMNVMSDTLTQLAGGKLSGLIEKVTGKRIWGWLFGTGLAVFVQSSVTTVMVVGLVNSGIMSVSQSVGVMIGANLGTTATAWLLSLNSLGGSFLLQLLKPSSFTPFLAIGGVVFLMFANNDKKKSIGTIVVGFSVMMIGMDMMSNAVAPLENVPAFNKMMFSVTNPFIGVLVGIACTLMIQSSAAAIGILQALAMSVGVTYGMAIPIVCGAQLGTCLTAILASLSFNNKGKRAAMIHLILVKLVHIVLPFSEAEKEEEADTLTILNPLFLNNPAFALDQVKTASGMLADVVQNYFDAYLDTIDQNTPEKPENVRLLGETAERYTAQLRKYCIRLSEQKMQDADAKNLAFLTSAVNNYGEMADKIGVMERSFLEFRKKGENFSKEADGDLNVFGSAVQEILGATVHDYSSNNTRLATTVQIYREVITDLMGKINGRNVKRLHSGECSPESSRVFSEVCTGYERIIDRCDSIARHILLKSGETAAAPTPEQYETIKSLFKDKYSELEE